MDPWDTPQLRAHARILIDSYRRWTGLDLLGEDLSRSSDAELAFAVFHAPRIIVSHGTQTDPILNLVLASTEDPQRVETLIARLEASADLPTYRYNIVLQGDRETVFFDS